MVRAMQAAVDGLIATLDLEPLELNVFRGRSPKEFRQRVFGGQVAGQALVAAGRTVEARTVHSLHAYFLRPGDPKVPIVYQVDRIHDGEAIFILSASFQHPEDGPEHGLEMPDVPPPESLPTTEERLAPVKDTL